MNDFSINWANNYLHSRGFLSQKLIPDIIQDNPWSTVYRFSTNQGFVFLKRMPPALALEPEIINLLNKSFHANVPEVIAVNQELNCFLMKDAGIPLYNYFKTNFQIDFLIKALENYSLLQIKTTSMVNLFFNLKVPDWRLENLPILYANMLMQEELLLNDGLSRADLTKLVNLIPKLESICKQLSRYNIKESFGHADFHDKNILININTLNTTLIDLGEVVITHPFFSLLNCIHRTKENFFLSSTQYKKLQLASFKHWMTLESEVNLFKIMQLIQQCWPIHSVLGELRLMSSVDYAGNEISRQGRLANTLRYWIDQ